MKTTRRWFKVLIWILFILAAGVYFAARPVLVRQLEPLVEEAAAEKVNGRLSWDGMELDPYYDLVLNELVLTDAAGKEIFRAPSLTVGWTLAGAFSAWRNDEGAAGMVEEVRLSRPSLSIALRPDGSWNVQNLLKPDKEESPGRFHGRILVSGGAAEVAPSAGQSYRLQDLEGLVSFLNAGQIEASLYGDFSGARFQSDLKYRDEANFDLRLKAGALPLALLRPLLDGAEAGGRPVSIQGGSADIDEAKVWKRGGVLSYHAAGRLEDAGAAVGEYTVTDGHARFDVYDGSARVEDIRGRVNGEKISGAVSLAWNDPLTVQGEVSFHEAELSHVVPDEDVSGIATGSVRFAGTPDRLSAEGDFSFSSLDLKGFQVDRGKVSAAWDGQQATVSGLTAELSGGGHVEGSGSFRLDNGQFDARLSAESASLSGLSAFGISSGTADGTVSLRGTYDGGRIQWQSIEGEGEGRDLSFDGYTAGLVSGHARYDGRAFQAAFYGEALSAYGVTVDSVSGDAEGTSDDWTIHTLSGLVSGGAFSLRGTASGGQLDMAVQAAGIGLAPFSRLAGEEIDGKLSFDGRILGTMENPAFDLEIAAYDGRVRGADIRRAAGRVAYGNQMLSLDGVTVDTETGWHTLSGTVGLSGDHALALHETSEHTRIENLLKLAGLDYPVTGWIQNETDIRGTLSNPEISGRFLAWEGSAAGELYDSLSGEYALRDGAVTISNGLAYMYGGAAYVNGMASKDTLDMELALVDVEMDRVFRELPVKGRATVRGRLSGAPDSPVFQGYMESRQMTAGPAEAEQLSAGIFYKDQAVEVTDGYFQQKGGKFRWNGMVDTRSGAVSGSLRFTGWALSDAFRLFQLPVEEVRGTMDGSMQLRGTMEDPNVSLVVNLNGGSLGSTPMGAGRIELSYLNKALSVREFRIPVGDGLLAARGNMTADGTLDMEVAANGMDVSWIPQIAGMPGVRLGGKLTAGLSLHGNRKAPEADVSVTVEKPSYNGIPFDTLSLMGNIGNGEFRINQALATKDAYQITAEGTIPASAITRTAGDRDVPFDVDINLDNADLNALALWVKPVTSASGPIRGHVKISGPWNDPEARGNIRIDQGTVTVASMSDPIEGIWGRLRFQGKEAILEGTAAVGGGSFSAAGTMSWDQMKLLGYQGEAHLHAPSIDSVYYKGAVDADLTAEESRGLPMISGAVQVQNATLDIPMSFEDSGGGLDFLMDISVNIGDRVRLYNSLLYDMNIRGNIHAMGLLSKPLMSGRVNVEKGTIRYLSNEFNVTEGTATWGGIPDSLLPVLNVRADTTVGHYKIDMDLKGPPGDFRFDLKSEPALNDSQIVTLLTFRQAPGSGNSDESTGALFNAGLQMAFSGGVQDFLKNSFGLDLISVTSSLTDYYDTSSMNDDFYYIKIGKYLFNDFMITATTGINNREQSFGFRYDLKSRVGLAAWYNSDHDSYIGADYRFKF